MKQEQQPGTATYGVRELQMTVRDSPMIPVEIQPFVGITFTGPEQVFKLMRKLYSMPSEVFLILHLNTKRQFAALTTVSIGTLDHTIIHPREVFLAAIVNLTATIICIHNHPSGSVEPSKEDLELTKRLKEAGKIIGIHLLDHLIIGKEGYFSFMEHGML